MVGWRSPAADAGPSTERTALALQLFGAMDVRLGDRPLPRLRSRKGLWLLALLGLRAGRDVNRSWIAATLWPECDEDHARRSLRQSLHDLRLALGSEAQRLSSEAPHTLRLDVPAAAVDALAFDTALARGDRGSLQAAIRLYRGPLLEDCGEEWSHGERVRRECAYTSALATLASAASANGDYPSAANYLRAALLADPYQEALQRALMQTLADGGDPAGALVAYRRYGDLLRREMAAEPAEETTALFRRLREETRAVARPRAATLPPPAPRSAAPVQIGTPRPLPRPLSELIGRDEDVREVRELLVHARLVTLTGTGGIGKTRLALQVAAELAGTLPQGVCFVSLAALGAPEEVPEAVRGALGLPPFPARREPAESLYETLAGSEMLLVLDNCEHLLPACRELAGSLLERCAGLRLLATSRQALGLGGERVWRVAALALPDHASPGVQNELPCAAMRLFAERARAVERTFRLTGRTAPAIAQICRRLDGIPLAIELAAARVRALPVEELAARLCDGFGLLAGCGSLMPRHQTLAATFDWSWNLLSANERRLLRRLSVFAGGWTLAAAEAVTAGTREGCGPGFAPEIQRFEVLDLLTALVDQSLVLYQPGDATGTGEARYSLLETVREYARARLRASDDWDAAQERHCGFYLQWAEEIKPKLWGTGQAEWFRRLEREQGNLYAALEWCRQQPASEQELRLVAALGRFWDTYGHLREGRAYLSAALKRMTPHQAPALRVAVLMHAGWVAYVTGDHSSAREHYHQALALLSEQDAPEKRADMLNVLALVAVDEGEFAAAHDLFQEALELCTTHETARLGSVLGNLGSLALRQGHYEAARGYLERSAAWCEVVGDGQLHGLVLHDLSVTSYRQGRYHDAGLECAASLRRLHDSGAVVNLPPVVEQMALIAQAAADWERAARLWGAAEGLRQQVGVPPLAHEAERGAAALAAAQQLLGPAASAAYAAGTAMGAARAIAYALEFEGG